MIMKKLDLENLADEYANTNFDHVNYTSGKNQQALTDYDKLKAAFLAGFNQK
jgi:hypothetical protein